jgi:hypothetical protein
VLYRRQDGKIAFVGRDDQPVEAATIDATGKLVVSGLLAVGVAGQSGCADQRRAHVVGHPLQRLHRTI